MIKPITAMAFYCCGVRMHDAASEWPVCDDRFAHLFMCDYGQRIYDLFKEEENSNASILVRHRVIDDLLRERLTRHPDTCIITLGAGFDSRPYRLQGGQWYELDEPHVVQWKEDRLPADDCPNPLQRIAIDFSSDNLAQKLATITPTGPVFLVIEGVFIYLSEKEILQSIAAFQQLFPKHQLACDLVSRAIVASYGRSLHAKIQVLGACFKAIDHPETVFTLHGYRIAEAISIVERAVDFGINRIPKLLLPYVFRGDVMGNAVFVFEPGEDDDDEFLL